MSIRKREWSIEKKEIAYVLENWLLASISITLDKEHNSMRSLFEPLVSNGYTLQMTPERLGWLEPTDAGLPLAQLRETYRQNGYLWLKGFFDRDVILDFHRFFFPWCFLKTL